MKDVRHIIETQQFDRAYLDGLFARTDDVMAHGGGDALAGKIMATFFYEPSTRTRLSFESAMLRLHGSVIGTENAKEFSSAAKGETLEDSIRIIDDYVDVIVIRHPEAGSAKRASLVSEVPVINAGDGAGQHPTQALLDLYTIQRELGGIAGKHIALVGDLKNGRTVRSLSYLVAKYPETRLTFVAPSELAMGNDIKSYLSQTGTAFKETDELSGVLREADVVYQTRIQKERFENETEYQKHKGRYVIDRTLADVMKDGAIIMHPLPRVDEIVSTVDNSPHARYFAQARYGLYVRMALLLDLLT